MNPNFTHLPSSFRDPAGFLFVEDDVLLRSVNFSYKENYDRLMHSGLYDKLVEENLLIAHNELDDRTKKTHDAYKLIQPEIVPFISYPFEWCFSQLKDAALATLNIQKQALGFNMILKDASAYNIQFYKGKPILIDTLSFAVYKDNQPWVAYRQFCQHFLAPLALMTFCDIRLSQLLKIYMDGIPLDLVSHLLPKKTWLRITLLFHIHMHAKAQKKFEKKLSLPKDPRVNKHSLIALIDHLESAIKDLKWQPIGTEWAEYYEDNNYTSAAIDHKKQLVEIYLKESNPQTVWDFGANTGVFSRIAAGKGAKTIAFDVDPAAVEKNYRQVLEQNECCLLPLCLDLTNPSPAIGWAHEERLALIERGPADTTLALALIHHLAISNNVPFEKIAEFLSLTSRFLIIEFIPKSDSQVERLLCTREDIFSKYSQNEFESSFQYYFSIIRRQKIIGTQRTLYLMEKRNAS